MNEHDANRALLEAASLRAEPDPLEATQRMPVADRRYRQAEGLGQNLNGMVTDAVWVELSKQREVDDYVDEMIRRRPDFRDGPRAQLTAHDRAQQDGFRDE